MNDVGETVIPLFFLRVQADQASPCIDRIQTERNLGGSVVTPACKAAQACGRSRSSGGGGCSHAGE
jgi:hypothetical protein